jgi:hypothetical protein
MLLCSDNALTQSYSGLASTASCRLAGKRQHAIDRYRGGMVTPVSNATRHAVSGSMKRHENAVVTIDNLFD